MMYALNTPRPSCHNLVVRRILLVLLVRGALFAQEMTTKTEIERDQALRRDFEAALAHDPESALESLPLVIDRPWMAEVGFRDACTLARASVNQPERTATLAARLVLMAGLHNPALALRESALYLPLDKGRRLFERFVLAAPGEAIALAAGNSQSARSFRQLMSDPVAPEFPILIRLAEDSSIDLPKRQRLAILAGRISRGKLSFEGALKIAGDTQRFFAAVLDMRVPPGGDGEALDRVLESESLQLCRAARENVQRTLIGDLARFRARDLYAMLSLGRAEATPETFVAVFDRLLAPRWTSEPRNDQSLLALLDQTQNWGLRDFASGALAAGRFNRVLSIAGPELIARLAARIDQADEPLKEGMRLAQIVEATDSVGLLAQMRSIVHNEWTRCAAMGNSRCLTIYGLLAAKLGVDAIGAPYRPFLASSETLDSASLFGDGNDCIQRHFFYDDDDGVKSFESFRRSYEGDPAWVIEDAGSYVHLTGRAPGRRIEIFANVPIDSHLPANRALEGEAQRRQQAISEILQKQGLVATVLVHRGHSFWAERTISYVARPVRLVILGSCGGLYEVRRVIESSHESQVIATRGIGETKINDAILKAVNDRILNGERVILWNQFWRDLAGRWGKNSLFQDYVAPHQDSGTVFLRAYYRFLDAH
jgi:hypothetical protein